MRYFEHIGLLLLCTITSTVLVAQATLTVTQIEPHSLYFAWGDHAPDEVLLHYGTTPNLELGEVSSLGLTGLEDATCYYVQAQTRSRSASSEMKLFSTASRSSGDITVYFNQTVDNTASALTDAIHVPDFEDTLVAYIDRVQTTLDVCNYNTGSLPIVNAVNAAESRGVIVRYIAADNTGTNNDELASLSATIPMIQRPPDGEVMHNKFLIIDAADAGLATIVTGSTNHTNNSCHNDYNNLVIVEDQSLALAYELEFEEMWGSTTNIPNLATAKFGNAKTDNTPHSFSIGGVPVELYFSPSDGTTAQIASAVSTANTDMQFALLTFTNNVLGDAVIDVHNSGVDTKGIIENVYYIGSEYSGLQSAGVDVYSHFGEPRFFHHKYAIVDANNVGSDPLVVTGSHNWSNSAEDDYDENTLIIHDAVIANMYFEEFMARYAEMVASGINESMSSASVLVYPNPTTDNITIETNQIFESAIVVNTMGQTLYASHSNHQAILTIDVGSWPDGIYSVILSNDQETVTLPVIVVH